MAPAVKTLVTLTAETIGKMELPLSRKRMIAEQFIAAYRAAGVNYNWDDFYLEAAGSKGT